MKKSGRLGSRCISSSNVIAGGPYDGGSWMMPNYIPRTRKSETSLLMKNTRRVNQKCGAGYSLSRKPMLKQYGFSTYWI